MVNGLICCLHFLNDSNYFHGILLERPCLKTVKFSQVFVSKMQLYVDSSAPTHFSNKPDGVQIEKAANLLSMKVTTN